MQISNLKSISLAVLFFLLSIKGAQDLNELQEWEIVNLPASIAWIKQLANQFSVAALAIVALLSVVRIASFQTTIATIIQAIILIWYYLRSVQVGSGDPLNYAACVLLVTWIITISTTPKATAYDPFENGLGIFFAFHIFTTITLTLLGYGYSIASSGSRLFGLAYHPNMLGAVSSLAFAFFLFKTYGEPRESLSNVKRKAFASLSFGALAIVILSGSRTAILISAIPPLFLLPKRTLASIAVAGVTMLLGGGLILTTFPDTPIGSAINRMLEAPLDNRNEVWLALIDDFFAYPVLGAGDRASVSASSYLTAFSGAGLMGGLLFVTMMAATTHRALKRVIKLRFPKTLANNPSVYEFLFLQITVASLFEAYMFDKFGLLQLLALLTMQFISKKVRFQ